MRYAISTDGKYVSAHFGRCPDFTLFDLNGDKIENKQIVSNPGHQPGKIPEFLNNLGVDCIVAGGMGMRASNFFSQYDINTIIGVEGTVDGIIDDILNSTLVSSDNVCNPGAGKGYGLDKDECDHE